MTVLSAQTIRKRLERLDEQCILITPLMDGAVQSHSVDVRLGPSLLVWMPLNGKTDFDDGIYTTLPATGEGWHLEPGKHYLGATLEYVQVPADLRCQLDGCSTEARRSLVIHQTGGSVDAGWRGHLTVEITVTVPQRIKPRARIGQLTFQVLDEPTDTPYRGRYAGDLTPQPPKERRG